MVPAFVGRPNMSSSSSCLESAHVRTSFGYTSAMMLLRSPPRMMPTDEIRESGGRCASAASAAPARSVTAVTTGSTSDAEPRHAAQRPRTKAVHFVGRANAGPQACYRGENSLAPESGSRHWRGSALTARLRKIARRRLFLREARRHPRAMAASTAGDENHVAVAAAKAWLTPTPKRVTRRRDVVAAAARPRLGFEVGQPGSRRSDRTFG